MRNAQRIQTGEKRLVRRAPKDGTRTASAIELAEAAIHSGHEENLPLRERSIPRYRRRASTLEQTGFNPSRSRGEVR